MIYFGAETGFLYALNSDGSLAWNYGTGNGINWTSPAIASDGTVYIGNNDGKLIALSTSSMGLANVAWPKFRHNNNNTGLSTVISGTLRAQESWRQSNFGDPSNSGSGADLNDPDHDGIVNLLEHTFSVPAATHSMLYMRLRVANQ